MYAGGWEEMGFIPPRSREGAIGVMIRGGVYDCFFDCCGIFSTFIHSFNQSS